MSKTRRNGNPLKTATKLASAGRQYSEHGIVNPGVYHASTILFANADAQRNASQLYTYGRRGTPTSRALEDSIAELEGGYGCHIAPSGTAAVAVTFMTMLASGDHILMADSCYGPTRVLCGELLPRMGIEVTFYDPLIGSDIKDLIKSNTRMVYTESPGSLTFEVQDIPAIAEAAHAAGALVCVDNTWSGGHYFKAFEHGCDISVQAATKYLVGHSDCMMGSITVNEANWRTFHKRYGDMGMFAGPDDMYLTLRGMRTLDVRLERHMKSGLDIANWLQQRDEVSRVLHPGLPGDPGHKIWKRDFTGASGLFGVVLNTTNQKQADAFLDALELFGQGASWGGFESLAINSKIENNRTATTWDQKECTIRLHIGLEDVDDLKADLDAAFKAMAETD